MTRTLSGLGFSVAVLAAVVGAMPSLSPTPVAAQTLEEVDSLVRIGQAGEARVVLSRWWEGSDGGAERREVQRALWLRGVLTVDPGQAKLDFQRLIVEYPGGAFTDEAILRLAELAEATGELPEAARWYRSLARDYPGSPARLQARGWLERNAEAVAAASAAAADEPADTPPRTSPALAEVSADDSIADPTDDPVADSIADSADDLAADSTDPPESAADRTVATGDFTVQLGAFLEEERARQLAERLREQGLEPRLVRVQGSGLLRVRIGRFVDAGPATRLYDRVVAMGYEAVVAADATREEPER